MKKTNKSKCPNLEQLELSLNAAGGINWEKKSFWKTVSVTAKHTHTLCCINSTPTEMHSRWCLPLLFQQFTKQADQVGIGKI